MRAMSADTISLMKAPTKKPIARVVNTVERAVGRRDLFGTQRCRDQLFHCRVIGLSSYQ